MNAGNDFLLRFSYSQLQKQSLTFPFLGTSEVELIIACEADKVVFFFLE